MANILKIGLVLTLLGWCGCGGSSSETGEEDGSTNSTVPGGNGGGTSSGNGSWTMESAFSTAPPGYAAVNHPDVPTALWGSLSAPFPTNTWWNNLVLGSGNNRVNVLPYNIKAESDRLAFCLPQVTVAPTHVTTSFLENLAFGAVESLAAHEVVDHDPLSVTVRWSGSGGGQMTTPLVQGMAYVSAKYENLTPRVATQHAVLSVNGSPTSPVTGTRFEVALNNGQTWVLYSSVPTSLNWDGSTLTFSPFSGWLRAALLPSPTDAPLLDAHAAAIPTGGEVNVSVAGDVATVEYTWEKSGSGSLLMTLLPHHSDIVVNPIWTPYSLSTIKGATTGVIGDSCSLAYPLATITWNAPSGIDPSKVVDVKEALQNDMTVLPTSSDPYFFGKEISRMGRLALIADELGEYAKAAQIRSSMKTHLDPWLAGTNPNPLKYDQTWGGICSSEGLANPYADFGNGKYNDHHFHYGYLVYAAACLAKEDPAWAAQKNDRIVDLIRAIANPSTQDPYFPRFRHTDWFSGHSWAAGLYEFADARNQESSSEAVNAWYAVQLYGLATGNADIENIGRVLLSMEIRSVQKYWQVDSADNIYPAPFSDNKVVGVLWSTKVDYATWFGSNAEFIHGIQMLPFTPISEALLEPSWVLEEYPVLLSTVDWNSIEEGWKGFLYLQHAVIAKQAAWTEVQTLVSYDGGNSRTNTLYWVATRP